MKAVAWMRQYRYPAGEGRWHTSDVTLAKPQRSLTPKPITAGDGMTYEWRWLPLIPQESENG